MKRKRVIINKNSKVRRQRDPVPWKYCVLTVVCGLLLVSGFFVAAKQHFSAIGVAMENADLRVRITKLKDEQRRLLLSKERASSPGRIAKLAKTIGFSTNPRPVISSTNDYQTAADGNADTKPVFSYASQEAPSDNIGNTDVKVNQNSVKKTADVRPLKAVRKTSVGNDQLAALSAIGPITSVRE